MKKLTIEELAALRVVVGAARRFIGVDDYTILAERALTKLSQSQCKVGGVNEKPVGKRPVPPPAPTRSMKGPR